MTPPLWSKQGCWTCRLRKKKCDEAHPQCSACESLSITCYGYGPKPDWMDGGEDERAVANGIKEVVKHTSRRKTAQSTRHRDPAKIAPKSASLSESSLSPAPSPDRPNPTFSADETALLMHFLDHVFPLQYPMYRPGIEAGGRGWLLSSLLHTESLYHAALSLGAYHRRTAAPTMLSQPSQIATLVQQEKHLETCIKSLNAFSQKACHNSELGVMMTVTQLSFLELFTNNGISWKAHLLAAMNMYIRNNKFNSAPVDQSKESRALLKASLPLLDYEALVSNEAAQTRFLGGTLIWLDIISCITQATTPHLLLYHSTVMDPDSKTRLEDIMGCKNWVMLQIGRISELYAKKLQALREGHFYCEAFKETIVDINVQIQLGLDTAGPESVALCNPPALVTPVFASMAFIYLHLVTNGFKQLGALDAAISRAMIMLQTEVPTHVLPAIVAPLSFKEDVDENTLPCVELCGSVYDWLLSAEDDLALVLMIGRNCGAIYGWLLNCASAPSTLVLYLHSRRLAKASSLQNAIYCPWTSRNSKVYNFLLLHKLLILKKSLLTMKNIVILGGSYAGVSTAHRIFKQATNNAPFKITLVSPNTHFYWNVASPRGIIPGQIEDEKLFQPISTGFEQYPSGRFEFVLGYAESLDVNVKRVTVSNNITLDYDVLIIGTGSNDKEGLPFKGVGSTEATRNALHDFQAKVAKSKTIVVCGAGVTGVEVAGELGFEYGQTKEIILLGSGPTVLEGSPASVSKISTDSLLKLNVDIKLQTKLMNTIQKPDGRQELILSSGENLAADLTIPTFGLVPNSSYIPGKFLNTNGYVMVDEYLKVKNAESVWALGDVCDTENSQILSCDRQSVYVAKAILSTLGSDKIPPPYQPFTSRFMGFQIGKKSGTGHFGWFRIPTFVVVYLRKNLFVERLATTVDGSQF
ncbi:hypothetical protein V494_01451 [Pseudogymnoascus sp. VKM F-4513 (FW-928)]|nr:hypothetical protein V494_01451 [Pseudogymnoascus sp. VKM F-4513 (FW-928)]